MWLLSHDGTILDGKRIWLRPGERHLIGRGTGGKTKTVSRKHLVVEVRAIDGVATTAGARPDYRSEVVLRDESKFGTTVDGGEQFQNAEKVLGGKVGREERGKTRYSIQLGKWDQLLWLEWHPVNITYGGVTSKKKGTDSVLAMRSRLERFDIKVLPDYFPGRTTHVIANKRNTPKALQALVNAKHIVTEAFVQAIENVAGKPGLAGDGGGDVVRSRLEEDFDVNWPKEIDYLPAPGNEPVSRPAEMWRPNPEREHIFAGYTFVFAGQNQFDHLSPVITQGGGKALIRELEHGSSDVEGFVRYVKNVAGEKGMGEFEDGSEGKGVVVVRLGEAKETDEEWRVQFFAAVDVALGQRSIKQNEFLDAIVVNDPSSLRQPLQPAEDEREAIPSSIPGPPPSTSEATSQVPIPSTEGHSQMPPPYTQNAVPAASQPPKQTRRGVRRALTVSRFTGFDKFDPSEIPKAEPDDDDEEMEEAGPSQFDPSQASIAQSQLPASSRLASRSQARATRRSNRHHEDNSAPIELSDEEDASKLVDALLPATTAMKKRKLQQQLENPDGEDEDVPAAVASPRKKRKSTLVAPSALRKAKPEKEIDVVALTRERREKEEEERRKDEESLREALQGMDIEAMRNLAVVEEMEIRPRNSRTPSGVQDQENGSNEDQWKPEWNGRKNFKKFRKIKPGQKDSSDSVAPIRGPRKVIVPLEEVKPIDLNTIDDEYFFESNGSRTKQPSVTSSFLENQSDRGGTRSGSRIRTTKDTDDDNDDEGRTGVFSRTGSRRPNSAHSSQNQRSSNNNDSGPANSIVLRPEDDAEMQDFDPEEIAGQPRSERIAELARQAESKKTTTVPLRDSQTSGRASRGSRRNAATPDPSIGSQTVVGEYPTQQQQATKRPGSKGSVSSAVSVAGGATKRGAMGPPTGAREPPRKRGSVSSSTSRAPVATGKGLGPPEDEDEGSGGSGDELRFRFRRRR